MDKKPKNSYLITSQKKWTQIPGYKLYYASPCGAIGSRYIRGARESTGDQIFEIKTTPSGRGYVTVHLYENGKRKTHQAHRLIAATFLGESKLFVNHKNLNKSDNRIENLEYVTQLENVRHAIRAGIMVPPPRLSHLRRKLTKEQVFEIIKNKETTCVLLGDKYKIQPSTIVKIRAGKAYIDWYEEYHRSNANQV